jgi:hypothetical protein
MTSWTELRASDGRRGFESLIIDLDPGRVDVVVLGRMALAMGRQHIDTTPGRVVVEP